jgi:hypothetical protein
MELSNNVFISENQFYTLYWKCNAALNETKCHFYWMQIHQLRFIHVLLYLSRKKGIRAIHLKEALFNIATKTTIFVEKNVITCNIAVSENQFYAL